MDSAFSGPTRSGFPGNARNPYGSIPSDNQRPGQPQSNWGLPSNGQGNQYAQSGWSQNNGNQRTPHQSSQSNLKPPQYTSEWLLQQPGSNSQNQPPTQNLGGRFPASGQFSSEPYPAVQPSPNTNTSGGYGRLGPTNNYQSPMQQSAPAHFVRNEFFCDKYDLVTAEKLNLRVAGEVHRSRNLLTGKEVCVWMLPVEDIPQTPTSGKNQVLQNNLASSEGLLSVFESFHDGHKYIIVTETFQQTLRDYIQSGTGVRDEIGLLDFALQLFSGAVTLAKIEALYLSWSVDEIFMVRSLQGIARPKFGVYGSPYDQMNKPKSGVQKTNLTAGEMNIWMGKLMFFMAYGQEHTGQPQTGKPRIPLSAGTSEMITNLLDRKSTRLNSSHSQI